MKKWDFIRGGFKFRITDEDALYWDIVKADCICKYSKHTMERALLFKNEYERDYTQCEYDCTGTTQIRIRVLRKGSRIIIKYHESKDN